MSLQELRERCGSLADEIYELRDRSNNEKHEWTDADDKQRLPTDVVVEYLMLARPALVGDHLREAIVEGEDGRAALRLEALDDGTGIGVEARGAIY